MPYPQYPGLFDPEFESRLGNDRRPTHQKFYDMLSNTNLPRQLRAVLAAELARSYDALKKETSTPSGITDRNKNAKIQRISNAYEQFNQQVENTLSVLNRPENAGYAQTHSAALGVANAFGQQAASLARNRSLVSDTNRRLLATPLIPQARRVSMTDFYRATYMANLAAWQRYERDRRAYAQAQAQAQRQYQARYQPQAQRQPQQQAQPQRQPQQQAQAQARRQYPPQPQPQRQPPQRPAARYAAEGVYPAAYNAQRGVAPPPPAVYNARRGQRPVQPQQPTAAQQPAQPQPAARQGQAAQPVAQQSPVQHQQPAAQQSPVQPQPTAQQPAQPQERQEAFAARFNGFMEREFEQQLGLDRRRTSEQKFAAMLKDTNLPRAQRGQLARELAVGYDELRHEMSDPSGITDANKNSRLGRAAGAYEKFYQAMNRTAEALSEPAALEYAAAHPAAANASAAFGHQAMFMATNRAFFSEAQRQLNDKVIPPETRNRSLNSILGDVHIANVTAVKAEEHGAVHEVYKQTVTLDDLAREVRVKPGERQSSKYDAVTRHSASREAIRRNIVNAPNVPEAEVQAALAENKAAQVDLDQKKGMGILPLGEEGMEPGRTFHNDSALRDRGEHIVGRMCGFGNIIVDSRVGMDDKTGVVSVMESAKGVQGNGCVVAADGTAAYDEHHDALNAQLLEQGLPLLPHMVHIDPANASLQTEMIKMGVVDYISGQFDRHPGNFFINRDSSVDPPKYTLTGIDNDSAFSSVRAYNSNLLDINEAVPFVTPEIRDNVNAINEEEMRGALMTTVGMKENGAEAVDLAMERVRQLKEHVNRPELLVPENQVGAGTMQRVFHMPEHINRAEAVGGYMWQYQSPTAKFADDDAIFAQRIQEKRERERNAPPVYEAPTAEDIPFAPRADAPAPAAPEAPAAHAPDAPEATPEEETYPALAPEEETYPALAPDDPDVAAEEETYPAAAPTYVSDPRFRPPEHGVPVYTPPGVPAPRDDMPAPDAPAAREGLPAYDPRFPEYAQPNPDGGPPMFVPAGLEPAPAPTAPTIEPPAPTAAPAPRADAPIAPAAPEVEAARANPDAPAARANPDAPAARGNPADRVVPRVPRVPSSHPRRM